MIETLRPLTYEDLVNSPDDGQRYEIISGELTVTPAPIASHQRVLLRLIRLLDDFTAGHGRGELFVAPFDVRLGPHDVVEPDLLVIGSDRGRVPGTENTFDGPPDLVVEIICAGVFGLPIPDNERWSSTSCKAKPTCRFSRTIRDGSPLGSLLGCVSTPP